MIHFSAQRLIGLCGLALASLLAGCGGASSTVNPLQASRVVALGDAFSDVGNGSLTSLGGRFTINGDGTRTTTINTLATPTTLAETMANFYGLWSTAPMARKMTSGVYPSVSLPLTGMVSYAVGNSMINPSASAWTGDTTVTYRDGLGGTDPTLRTQVTQFLADGGPRNNDLIVVTAGTRDLLSLAVRYLGRTGNTTKKADGVTAWTPPTDLVAKLGGELTLTQVSSQLDAVAAEMVTQLDRLITAGAKHVVVLEPMNLSRTPWGLSLDATSVTFLRSLSYDTDTNCIKGNNQNSLHCKLTIALSNKYPPTVYGQKLLAVDLAQYINLMSGTTATGNANTYGSYFTQLPSIPACSVNPPIASPMQTRTFGGLSWDASSLSTARTMGCVANATNPAVSGDDPWTDWVDTSFNGFMFADNLNLTPQGNALLANYVFNSSMYRAAWR
jgi:phospholipase/lecithinase/hemolysin